MNTRRRTDFNCGLIAIFLLLASTAFKAQPTDAKRPKLVMDIGHRAYIEAGAYYIEAVAFSPDGRSVLTGSRDKNNEALGCTERAIDMDFERSFGLGHWRHFLPRWAFC
jgi:hypothetical protein